MDGTLFRDKCRISARKSYRICPMCRGKGYFDDNSVDPGRPCLQRLGTPSNQEDVDDEKKEVLTEIDKRELLSQSSDIGTAASVPYLSPLRSQGGSAKFKIHNNQKLASPTVLPNKFTNNLQQRRSLERLSAPDCSPRKSSRKLRSCGSETSLHSDSSDLLNLDRYINNPKETLRQAKIKIKNTNWDTAMSGLEDIAILSVQLPELWKQPRTDVLDSKSYSSVSFLGQTPDLDWETIGSAMTKLVASFHVQKTRSIRLSCQILRELFKTMTTTVHRPQFDNAVNELIKRSADTSRLVRWDAQQALDTMIKHVPVQFSMRAVLSQAPRHKNVAIRQTAMRLTHTTVESVTPRILLSSVTMKESRKLIINTLCSLIDDPNQNVRWLVRRTLQSLMCEDTFEDILNSETEPQILKKADRSLVLLQYSTDIL